jgi:hypothetical protein
MPQDKLNSWTFGGTGFADIAERSQVSVASSDARILDIRDPGEEIGREKIRVYD